MNKIYCPICGPKNSYQVKYKENLPLFEIVFSARKNPDSYHYRILKCDICGLLYSSPILENNKINKLYKESEFNYDAELENLKETYGNYLKKIENIVPSKENILEIGCGNGFFLQKALEMGYKNIYGIEPSNKAIQMAPESIKDNIINDIFDTKYFKKDFFDVICFFQVIEHIVDVNKFLIDCRYCLRENGVILGIAHNADAFFPRMLKDRCPIINNEHFYIFNKKTLQKIFFKNKFQVIKINSVANIYSLAYWIRMMPVPNLFKKILINILTLVRFINCKVAIKAGNIFIIAKKVTHHENIIN